MAENAEDRFKRAMDRLFAPAAKSFSVAGRDKREAGTVINPDSTMVNQTSRLLWSAKSSPSEAKSARNLHQVCRPWDRGDLFRRLATFKSMTWFGKPEVAGPINCARNGWVNVDVDLLACEGCSGMLSFPCPPTWSQHEVESAAASFSGRLDSGHKALCPWKGNACTETLAQFPPTPVEVLAEAFQDRCDALYQLSALPALSSFTVDYLKKSKGSQVEHFISQPASNLVVSNGIPDGASVTAAITAYYEAQRIISLCGWELRLLPYVVDCEDDNADFLGKNPSSNNNIKDERLMDSRPKVLLYSSKKPRVKKDTEMSKGAFNQEQKCDVGSAVLDCSLCGASVGLWLFSKVPRPSSWITAEPLKAPVECEFSAASGIQWGSCGDQRGGKTEKSDIVTDAVSSGISKVESKPPNVLTLKLTIAGGPRPTQLGSHKIKPSVQLDSSGNGNEIIKTSEDQDIEQVTQKGSLIGNTSTTGAIGEERRDNSSIMKKRRRADDLEDRVAMERDFLSSVDAVDTCFINHPENSAESVGMPQKRLQNTVTSVEDSDHVMQSRLSDVGMSGFKSNVSPLVDSKHAVEDTDPDVLLHGSRADNTVFEGSCCESGIREQKPDGRATSSQTRRMSNEGSNKGCETATEVLHPPERSDHFKQLFDDSTRQFDPILQHRHFCPWVNTNLGRGSCGWQLTLDALESSLPAVKSESASSVCKADPLLSVRKIFGRSPTGQKVADKQ